MQRLQKTICVGGILGLCLSFAAPAQAQVYYVQSSNFRAAPVSQSVVQTRTFVSPRSSNYSYGSGYGNNYYGSHYGSNYGSNYSYGQAWNTRTSGPAKYSETTYLPESNYVDHGVSSQSFITSQPVVSSGVVSARSFVAVQPRTFSQPVVTYRSVVSPQPVTYLEPVETSQPVRVYRSVVSSPRVIRAEVACPSKSLALESEPTVTFSESADGRRVKTYRYVYELDHRPGRVTIEFDSKN